MVLIFNFREFCEEKKFEFQNLAKITIIISLLKKNENSRILNFVKSPKIRNSQIFEHAKITRYSVVSYNIPELRGLSFCDHSWFVALHYVD